MLKVKLTITEMGHLINALMMSRYIFHTSLVKPTDLDDLLVEHMADFENRLASKLNPDQKKYTIRMSSVEAKAFTLWFLRSPLGGTEAYVVLRLLMAIDRQAKNPKPNPQSYE